MLALIAMGLAATAAPATPERCSLPTVVMSEADGDFRVRFWYQTPRRRTVEANVRAAFKSACKYGLLKGSTIPKLSGASTRRLFLENQPNANGAILEADQNKDGSWRLILGYPFIAADRSVNVPTAAEIQEAIHCAVRGASAEEQAATGRCLPD